MTNGRNLTRILTALVPRPATPAMLAAIGRFSAFSQAMETAARADIDPLAALPLTPADLPALRAMRDSLEVEMKRLPQSPVVTDGCFEGSLIRKARKRHRCDYWHGLSHGGRCKRHIEPGEFYVEGDPNDTAGGFGNDRYCRECVDDEARAAITRAESPL